MCLITRKFMEKLSAVIFVYNANSGLFATVKDGIHKLVAPDTYPCNLCKITYDAVSMEKEWRDFWERLPYSVSFLHKDQFQARFPNFTDRTLPAVFVKSKNTLKELISANEINTQRNVNDLMRLIVKKLSL